MSPLSLDYDVTVSLRKDELRQYNGMVLEIKLERQLLQSLIELILPPILLVMVSWVRLTVYHAESCCCKKDCD